MSGRTMAWHKPIITGGLILVMGREVELCVGKGNFALFAREHLAPPQLRRPYVFDQVLGLKGV